MKIDLNKKERNAFIIVGILIFLSPLLFTRDFGLISFEKTGPIGDTIGGITAPFLNFFGAILIYLALKAQIDANDKIQTQFKVQKTNEHFYKMLDIHLNNVSGFILNSHKLENLDEQCEIHDGNSIIQIEESFSSAFDNYFITLPSASGLVKEEANEILRQIDSRSIQLINLSHSDEVYTDKRTFLLMLKDFHFCHYSVINSNDFFNYNLNSQQLNELAYRIFFWGTDSNHIYAGGIDKEKAKNIKRYLFRIRKVFRENKGAKHSFSYDTNEGNTSVTFRFVPFSGHSSRLAHYYRHLYQTVKFLHLSHKDELITDLELESNLKILRAQFTNEEVLLLYYNYLIGFGANWDKKGEHNYPFFRKYNLLHNIPLYDNIPKSIEHPLKHFSDYIREQKKIDKDFQMFEWEV